MVMKLDGGGNITGEKRMAQGNMLYFPVFGKRVTEDLSSSGNASDTAMYPQDGNAWIFRLAGSGGIAWQKSYGENGYLIYSIEQTSDGGYIAAGEYACGSVEQGIWIVLNSIGNGDDCVAKRFWQ